MISPILLTLGIAGLAIEFLTAGALNIRIDRPRFLALFLLDYSFRYVQLTVVLLFILGILLHRSFPRIRHPGISGQYQLLPALF